MIIITGQTSTGKTKLALELAEKHNGELINFDSRQIYKYLDIITGKDLSPHRYLIETGVETSGIPAAWSRPFERRTPTGKKAIQAPFKFYGVWLYDIVTPDQYFSSFDFVKKITPVIEDMKKRGKVPILVGGTYLYLKHFLYGIDYNDSPPNFKLRKKLNNKSVVELQKKLISLNRQIFENLNHSDQLNPRRLIRRIEIEMDVKTSEIPTGKKARQALLQFQIIGLKYKDKSKLRKTITKRVEERLKNGAIEEVKKLLKMGYKKSDPGLKTIGYQQIIKYLNKEFTKEKAVEDWINKEVQYAKRQLTFMKKDKNIEWREV
jgi:tRNA dimethylallyltransferase